MKKLFICLCVLYTILSITEDVLTKTVNCIESFNVKSVPTVVETQKKLNESSLAAETDNIKAAMVSPTKDEKAHVAFLSSIKLNPQLEELLIVLAIYGFIMFLVANSSEYSEI